MNLKKQQNLKLADRGDTKNKTSSREWIVLIVVNGAYFTLVAGIAAGMYFFIGRLVSELNVTIEKSINYKIYKIKLLSSLKDLFRRNEALLVSPVHQFGQLFDAIHLQWSRIFRELAALESSHRENVPHGFDSNAHVRLYNVAIYYCTRHCK